MNFNFKGKKVFFFSCFNYDYLKEKKNNRIVILGSLISKIESKVEKRMSLFPRSSMHCLCCMAINVVPK